MSVKVTAAAFAEGALKVGRGPDDFNVTRFCASEGVTPKTFYKWVNRYRDQGAVGLEELPRRPHATPHATPLEVEELIVRVRKELDDAGLDHGPTTIVWHLRRRRERGDIELDQVPHPSTVWRILVRRGHIVAEPKKRPNTATKRFEAPAPNEWWQIDATDWVIATGTVKIFNLVDDHSRVATGSWAAEHATGEQAWAAFSQAAAAWGLPAGMLSDNGLCFSGKLRGFEVMFEKQLRDVGIRPFTGRPYHPQTTGKVERFQQTLKKWLRKQPLANTLAELQTQLDQFRQIYNFERPHQGIGRQFPIQRWQATPVSGPASEPLAHPRFPGTTHHSTVTNGVVSTDRYVIHIGVDHDGQNATINIDNNRANVFINNNLTRHLELDHTRRYQPSGKPRGGPHRPRLHS